MSTLPPTPKFNPNIPIISSAGGTSVAYKNPKSPESIMKKTTLLQAQSEVDTMYDVDLKKEGFKGFKGFKGFPRFRGGRLYVMYAFILLLLIALFTQRKRAGKMYIALLASILLIITILNSRS
jgi:hypothetical protein